MATLNESPGSKASKGRTKKTSPRVDLTAMVDLMFLLTTFFMLTTTLGQLNAADIAKPVKTDIRENYPASRTMTILLGKNNQAFCYMGETDQAQVKRVSIKDLQSAIVANQKSVAKTHHNNPQKFMIVVLKPSSESKFQDFVDAIDELKIAGIQSYAIDDANITAQEVNFMKVKGI